MAWSAIDLVPLLAAPEQLQIELHGNPGYPGGPLLASIIAVVLLEEVRVQPGRAGVTLVTGPTEGHGPGRRRPHLPSVLEERALILGMVAWLNHHVGYNHQRPPIADRASDPHQGNEDTRRQNQHADHHTHRRHPSLRRDWALLDSKPRSQKTT